MSFTPYSFPKEECLNLIRRFSEDLYLSRCYIEDIINHDIIKNYTFDQRRSYYINLSQKDKKRVYELRNTTLKMRCLKNSIIDIINNHRDLDCSRINQLFNDECKFTSDLLDDYARCVPYELQYNEL